MQLTPYARTKFTAIFYCMSLGGPQVPDVGDKIHANVQCHGFGAVRGRERTVPRAFAQTLLAAAGPAG